MIGAINLFEELRHRSCDILPFLASNERINSAFAATQMKEERFKAQLMCGERKEEWLPQIIEAEKMKFFKGNIACLLRHDDKVFVEDIECFKTKLSHAQTYFDDNGVRTEYALPLTQALIRVIHHWDQLVERFIFDTSSERWREYILHGSNPGYYREVHTLLLTDDLNGLDYADLEDGNDEWVYSANKIKKLFSETSFIDNEPFYRYGKIVSNGSEWRLHWFGGVLTFFPYRKNHAYCLDWVDTDTGLLFRRNALLSHPKIQVDNPCKEGVYWSWSVYFKYNGSSFMWDYDNVIYLCDNDEVMERDAKHKNDNEDQYFSIDMDLLPDLSQQGLLVRLTRLANEAL